MARISGIELNDKWRVVYALTRLKGIGWPLAEKIIKDMKIESSERLGSVSAENLALLNTELEKYTIEGDLVRKTREDIHRLREIGSYRGMRHSRGLPARGQRTKSNARTKRGKRKTVGAFKKDTLAKMAPAK